MSCILKLKLKFKIYNIFSNLDSKVTVPLSQELMYYIGVPAFKGATALNAQPSGAYIFRPNETAPLSFHADLKKNTVFKKVCRN
jgi:hypothetical protein